jgi:uncharacterized protein YqhQ
MSEFLQYGGQAVIEGVMMRSPKWFAVACRRPDGGIELQAEHVEKTFIGKLMWLNKPFLRGTLALLDAMALGMKALSFSANVQAVALPGQKDAAAAGDPAAARQKRINDIAIASTMVFSICFGVGLFVALPTLLTQLAQRRLGIPMGPGLPWAQQTQLNFIDGVIRITIFLGYIALISRLENIRRVFQYHGAEHKAINTLEAGLPLTPTQCMQASRIHPRCGTSFIIVVLLAGILVHSVFPRPDNYFVRLALHISLIPLVAGMGYEAIRWAGKYRHLSITRWVLAPGLWSQRLTTREPDISQVEIALAALQAVISREEGTNPAATEADLTTPSDPAAAVA